MFYVQNALNQEIATETSLKRYQPKQVLSSTVAAPQSNNQFVASELTETRFKMTQMYNSVANCSQVRILRCSTEKRQLYRVSMQTSRSKKLFTK